MRHRSFALSLLLLASSCSPLAQPMPLPNRTGVQAQREAISAFVGDAPNFAASSNGNFLTVVSGPHGRGAKAGALVELYWPNIGEDHLWDAYSGVAYDGKFYWLHQFKLESQSVLPDTDIVVSRFVSPDGRLQAELQDVVMRDQSAHVRNLTLTNRSAQPLQNVSVTFYSYLTANLFPTGDRCEYQADSGTIHHYENQAHFAVALEQPAAQFQCGGVQNYLTAARDARDDAQDGKLTHNPRSAANAGLGVNEALSSVPRGLAPGQSISERAFITAGADKIEAFETLNRARQQNWNALVSQNQLSWQTYLAKSKYPVGMSAEEMAVYRRALIVMKQHSAPSGAHLAAPTSTSPPYRFSWPRDGSFIAYTHLMTGHPEESRKFLDFMARAQKPNGGWAINYMTSGQALYDFGDRQNEHDQVGTIPWMMMAYARQTQDWNWLQGHWPSMRKAGDYLLQYQDLETGLMGPTRDLWELSTTDSWAYSNAAAYAGLRAIAEAAQRFGDSASQRRFSTAADRMKQGIESYLWDASKGYFARGFNLTGKRQDPKVEAANLALAWPFEVFAYDDPRMIQMADKILKDLSSPAGGIRRYTGDRYYDGQAWPVTTEWLSIYYSKLGRKDLAAKLHGVSTSFAYKTGSLQLGEQFDEAKGIWVSATPLTWSEAKYVLGAWALRP